MFKFALCCKCCLFISLIALLLPLYHRWYAITKKTKKLTKQKKKSKNKYKYKNVHHLKTAGKGWGRGEGYNICVVYFGYATWVYRGRAGRHGALKQLVTYYTHKTSILASCIGNQLLWWAHPCFPEISQRENEINIIAYIVIHRFTIDRKIGLIDTLYTISYNKNPPFHKSQLLP